jgi:nickel transport protein
MDSVLDRRSNTLSIATLMRLAFAVLTSIVFIVGAEAHKLKAFATAEGALISGYAYFTPGGRAQQADVTITGPGGVEVLKTGVNQEGEFRFVAKQRVDYTITVDGGDSHIANFTIHASDLPDSLPAPADGKILPLDPPAAAAAAAADVAPDSQAAEPAPSSAAPAAAGAGLVAIDPATLRALIRESVAREVNPLREQLDAFQEQVGWRDVVSGLGYIFGLCGVAYFFGTWRANRRFAPASQPQTREAARKAA